MTDLPTFPWFDQAPENLKTRRQLGELGLAPGGPVVAQVVWRRGKRWADLFDVHVARPKNAPTAAQLAALEAARCKRSTCPSCHTVMPFVLPRRWWPERDCDVCVEREIDADRLDACRKAARWLADPATVLLDTETTDLGGYVVDLAIVDTAGAVLFESRLNPLVPIEPGAREVHGLTDEDVGAAPTFAAVAEPIRSVLDGRRLVAFNADFDAGVLAAELRRVPPELATGWPERKAWRCAMKLYARFVGERWWDGGYRWQPLPGARHAALGDARATLAVLQRMAERAQRATERP